MVAEACREWQLPQLTHPARLIMSELVSNAAAHAGTDMVAAVSLRQHLLHLAVRDFTTTLPRLIDHDHDGRLGSIIEQRGAGLHLVRRAATGWGALPCAGGKVVWATLAVNPA